MSLTVDRGSSIKPQKKQSDCNYNRSRKLSMSSYKNLSYSKDVDKFLNNYVIDDPKIVGFLEKYKRDIQQCSACSLYRLTGARNVTLITSLTCDHRFCCICNMLRCKKLQKNFYTFFESEEQNVKIKEKHFHFLPNLNTSECRLDKTGKRVAYTSGSDILKQTDCMHLTLTVPHALGWNGHDYYAKQLLQRFHALRKCQWWTDMVFGGEYSVETTNNNGSLHIHIHALLMVKKASRSRNILYAEILQKWNELTIDTTVLQPKLLPPDRIQAIAKGLQWLSEDERNNILLDLDSRGSTMVGLKSLYHEVSITEYNRLSRAKFEDRGKYYKYCNSKNIRSLLKGVLECLKYHFEPCSIETVEGALDVELLTVLLPNIFRQRLYGKFGCLYGLTQLNMVEKPISINDLIDEATENANEILDPRTGLPLGRSEYSYIIASPRNIAHDKDKKQSFCDPDKVKYELPPGSSITMRDAVKSFAIYGLEKSKEDKREALLLSSFEKIQSTTDYINS